jgi:RNA polymerase sigma factor (sigma-70 family)
MDRPSDNPIPTRYSLLSRLQRWDDHESWKDFFDTYWRLIYSVALKAGLNEAEAQDVVQDTIICVAKDIHKFKRDRTLGSFKGWLRNIVRWRIADQLRKRDPRNKEPETRAVEPVSLEAVADASPSPLELAWEEEWRQNLLSAALDRVRKKVKEEQFQIFDLYVSKQWPVTKVAKTFGISVGRVYLAKHRVGALIKQELSALQRNPFPK